MQQSRARRVKTVCVWILLALTVTVAYPLQDQPPEPPPLETPSSPANYGWLSLLPPLISILLALLFRQIVPALLAGVWAGAWILHGGPLIGMLRTMDSYIVGAASDADHVAIIIFSLLLGGMVGLISRSGGTIGMVEALTPFATSSRRGQLVTWFLGLLIFFDDYANTLLVGNTMRPVTDRLKISREKLAFMVDSTAAPVASVALISTWIGSLDAYAVFLQSLLYRFYPFLALVFGLLIAGTLRDFGPMAKAERRAAKGKLLADTAVPLADFDNPKLEPPADKPRRWINAVLPVLVVLFATFCGLWATGRASLAADGLTTGIIPVTDLVFRDVGTIFGAGNSFHALLWASLAGCLTAAALPLVQRILTMGEALAAWSEGIKSMTLAFVILVLAWSISAVCSDLNTSGFMVDLLSDNLDPRYLSTLVFLIAAVTSFATGTSWGTMGILIPLAVPTAFGLAQSAGFDPEASHRILLGSISAVLAGAIFGDHCSPISDTTVLSSIASGCDHIDHVRTQMPYALTVAGVATLLGYLPSGFGVNPLLCMLVGCAALVGILVFAGKPRTA